MKNKLSSILLLISLPLISSFSFAEGGLEFSPMYIHASAEEPNPILTLTNKNPASVTYEITAQKWSQADNKDILSDTHSLLVSPRIATIQPGQTQIVRIHPETFSQNEETYRILIQELPNHEGKPTGSGIQFLTNLNLPVFVASNQAPVEKMAWEVKKLSNHELRVTATNEGNVHARVSKLAITEPNTKLTIEQNVFGYVLPGQSYSWTIPLTPKNELITSTDHNKQLALTAVTNHGTDKENVLLS